MLPCKNSRFREGQEDEIEEFNVGIVGAGAAGLFTAMIFDHLKEKYGLKVKYEILEASREDEDRLGGRLFSYYFKDKPDHPKIGPHDYYDVGAMRFPDNDIMARYVAQVFCEASAPILLSQDI